MGKLDDVARARILAWLRASGKTQADLGRDIGRNQSWMSRYLDGEFDADLDTLQRIAFAFDHTLTALLNVPGDAPGDEAREHFNALRKQTRDLALSVLKDWANPPVTPGRSRKQRGRTSSGGAG
jgi:transcriptional regulator with XRE-family HTH domain